MSSSEKRGQHPCHAVMRTRAWWGGYWVNPLFVCRGKAVSAPAAPRFCELRQHSTAMSSGLDEKGHLMILRCQLPHPFTPERPWPLFLLPPASRHRALGSIGFGSSWTQGGRFCWLGWRPTLRGQGPTLKVCPFSEQ